MTKLHTCIFGCRPLYVSFLIPVLLLCMDKKTHVTILHNVSNKIFNFESSDFQPSGPCCMLQRIPKVLQNKEKKLWPATNEISGLESVMEQ